MLPKKTQMKKLEIFQKKLWTQVLSRPQTTVYCIYFIWHFTCASSNTLFNNVCAQLENSPETTVDNCNIEEMLQNPVEKNEWKSNCNRAVNELWKEDILSKISYHYTTKYLITNHFNPRRSHRLLNIRTHSLKRCYQNNSNTQITD